MSKNNFQQLEEQNDIQLPHEVKSGIDGTKNALGVLGGIVELILPRIIHAFVGFFNGDMNEDKTK